jgi:hypothetical protein
MEKYRSWKAITDYKNLSAAERKSLVIKIWFTEACFQGAFWESPIALDEAESLIFFNIKEIDYYISLISF